MKTGIFIAILLHVGFILFGGLIFNTHKDDKGSLTKVDLLGNEDPAAPDKKQEEAKVKAPAEEIEPAKEAPPDATDLVRNMERSGAPDAPALAAASLSAIEAALSGKAGGGGDFGQSLDLGVSGGRIGGRGLAGVAEEKIEEAFSMADIDQKPRVVYQAAPVYPADMRGKKIEGIVSVIFVVSSEGRVINQRAEKSTHVAFERPALEAVRQWKFEAGLRGGQRVATKMRVSIRFQRS